MRKSVKETRRYVGGLIRYVKKKKHYYVYFGSLFGRCNVYICIFVHVKHVCINMCIYVHDI